MVITWDNKCDKQAGWFLRPDCAPSCERPQFRMPPVRNAPELRSLYATALPVQSEYLAPTVVLLQQCHCRNRHRGKTSKSISSSVSFVQIQSNFFTIHRRHRRKKMMDQNFEIRLLWVLRIFRKFSKRRRAVPLRPIWTIMVAAKLDQSRVLVTKFRQNRLTLKGRSAGQRHTDRQTDTQTDKLGWK